MGKRAYGEREWRGRPRPKSQGEWVGRRKEAVGQRDTILLIKGRVGCVENTKNKCAAAGEKGNEDE